MGWGRGSELMNKVIETLKRNVPDSAVRAAVYMDVIRALDDFDWDTEQESVGRDWVFDEALQAVREAEAVAQEQKRVPLVHYWPAGHGKATCGATSGMKAIAPSELACPNCINGG